MKRPMLMIVLTAAMAVACRPFVFGDPVEEVIIENRTEVALRVYQDGAVRKLPLDIQPHASIRSAFEWPIDRTDGRLRTIVAEDSAGKLVYCERFSYQDLMRAKWHIAVEERNTC